VWGAQPHDLALSSMSSRLPRFFSNLLDSYSSRQKELSRLFSYGVAAPPQGMLLVFHFDTQGRYGQEIKPWVSPIPTAFEKAGETFTVRAGKHNF